MGRTVKRVPMDFAWPRGKPWAGYTQHGPCPTCRACTPPGGDRCPECYGEMVVGIHTDPPEGDGWQFWETTTEGSPKSPVFRTAEELAVWCAAHGTIFGYRGMAIDDWRRWIAGEEFTMNLDTGEITWGPPWARKDGA